jgi:hypothetical protein
MATYRSTRSILRTLHGFDAYKLAKKSGVSFRQYQGNVFCTYAPSLLSSAEHVRTWKPASLNSIRKLSSKRNEVLGSETESVGLFGVPGLHRPEDFEKLADRSFAHVLALLQV